ncbi:hypothetical protein HGA91_03565 [candidate division WWE3 bacterium]|nr:hypothetical protein [candidate division WWE3 bacterium]
MTAVPMPPMRPQMRLVPAWESSIRQLILYIADLSRVVGNDWRSQDISDLRLTVDGFTFALGNVNVAITVSRGEIGYHLHMKDADNPFHRMFPHADQRELKAMYCRVLHILLDQDD